MLKLKKGLYTHIADFVSTEINTIIRTRFKMSNVNFEKKWACGLSITNPECATMMNNFTEDPIIEYRCRRCNETHTFIDEWSEQKIEEPSVSKIYEYCIKLSYCNSHQTMSRFSYRDYINFKIVKRIRFVCDLIPYNKS